MLRFLTDLALVSEYITELEEVKKLAEINNEEYEDRCKKLIEAGYTQKEIEDVIGGLYGL